jgi:hypothetical protein
MQVSPAGTAVRADVVVLLDVPAPWPKPIADQARLVAPMAVVAAADTPTRLFATMPVDERIRLIVFRNEAGVGVRSTYLVTDDTAIPDAIRATIEGRAPRGALLVEEPAPRPSLLVCAQGTHDVCCGSDGTRLSSEVERALSGVDVYRISHTGGHRFAPTAMTMPDGRMWAWLDVDDVRRIFEAAGDHVDLARRCRGWWGADAGAPQAAEVAVFTRHGWDAMPRGVSGHGSAYAVHLRDRTVEVRVDEARTVPTIACRAPGGLPAKQGVEYRAEIV